MATYLGKLPGSQGERYTEAFDPEVGQLRRTLMERHRVQSTNTNETRPSILATVGVPQIYALDGTGLRCVKRTLERVNEKDALLWDVACEFSHSIFGGLQMPPGEDEPPPRQQPYDPAIPQTWPIKLTISTEWEELPLVLDAVTDVPVVNSAEQEFDPLPTKRTPIMVKSYRAFKDDFVESDIRQFVGRVNSRGFMGGAVHQVLLDDITGEYEYVNDIAGAWVTYTFKIHPDTWDLKIIDQGTYYYEGGTTRKNFLDEFGNVGIGNLDGAGDAAAVGATPVSITFNRYPEINLRGTWPP